MELARGIEPPTCGLQNVSSPTADNLTPQETTKDDSSDRGQDGASLSCPGSSVVAGCGQDTSELNRLINSSADLLPQDTPENQEHHFPTLLEGEE